MTHLLQVSTLIAWALFFICLCCKLTKPQWLTCLLIGCIWLSFLTYATREIPSPVPFPTLEEMTQLSKP